MHGKINQLLAELGLNNLEAEVYTFLLVNESQTAYRIGKKLSKPTANVYKAIEVLARKGGVLISENEKNRLCTAVSAKEFLQQLQQNFQQQITEAETALSQLEPEYEDEAVYRLESVPLAIERCRNMLKNVKEIAVVDAFPLAFESIRDAVEEAAERGVEIHLQLYSEVELDNITPIYTALGAESIKHWQCQQLNVVTDGEEHLIALFNLNMTELYQAVWSRSLYQSCILHVGLIHEQTIMRLNEAKEDHEAIKKILNEPRFFRDKEIPGRRKLFTKFVDVKQQSE